MGVDVTKIVSEDLKQTPLHPLHLDLGARMAPFAGYDMPVQFATGVLKEHLQTRAAAGLFDVSHMGQLTLRAKSGSAMKVRVAFAICALRSSSSTGAEVDPVWYETHYRDARM